MVDDQHVNSRTRRFELEAELLLDSREDRRLVGRGLIRRPLQVDLISAREIRAINDDAVGRIREQLHQEIDGDRVRLDETRWASQITAARGRLQAVRRRLPKSRPERS